MLLLPNLPVRKSFLSLFPLSLQILKEIFSSSLFLLKFAEVLELCVLSLKLTLQI